MHLCDECPKIYLKQRTLELHKKRVHRGTLPTKSARKSYNCEKCNKTFTSGNNLEEHIKVKHEQNTPEHCDECNRSFGTPHALKGIWLFYANHKLYLGLSWSILVIQGPFRSF